MTQLPVYVPASIVEEARAHPPLANIAHLGVPGYRNPEGVLDGQLHLEDHGFYCGRTTRFTPCQACGVLLVLFCVCGKSGTLPGVDAHGIVGQEHKSDHQSPRSGLGSLFQAGQRQSCHKTKATRRIEKGLVLYV